MSTYVLMRILESTPRRYDRGIRLLTLGRLDRAYDELAARIRPGDRVLDIGCGTGALALRAARRGARVKGIDVNPAMLEIARKRVDEAGLGRRVQLAESGVADLDAEPERAYDAVTAGLVFSELGEDALDWTLGQVCRLLRPGGLLLAADEVLPAGAGARLCQRVLRAPLVALAWLLTQQTTRPVARLPERIVAAELELESVRRNRLGSFASMVARRPLEAA